MKALPPHGCDNCNKDTVYSSLYGALCHLHRYHIHCTPEARSILKDPCVGWVQWQPFSFNPKGNIVSVSSKLINTLTDVRERTRKINLSVSGKETRVPGSLVSFYESITTLLNVTAKEISGLNCERLQNLIRSDRYWIWQNIAIRGRAHNVESKLKSQLEDARRDVMMASETQSDIDRLTISPIGLEFLLRTLLRNLHARPIYQKTNKKLDVVEQCRVKSTALRFVAVRDPKRRRFLEISALEEEMEALRIISEVQTRTVKTYNQVLSPDFFTHNTTDWVDLEHRKDMYALEKGHLDTHIQSLVEDGKTLEILQRILTATRHDMKQMIEVLDEGHGKAIRVFTFVTLFFLPL
jgi:hypothetical protein